jgi:uncharacterized protein
MRLVKKIAFVVLLLLNITVSAQMKLPARPNPPKLVNDFTGTLTADQAAFLEQKLVAFDDSTSTQIAIVVISSTDGYEISEYNVELGRAWGVGGKQFNNGVVLLVTKKDRKLNIATGYGSEGALPDITCKHIIDDVIVPKFRGNDYFGGINSGVDVMMKALQGEYKAPEGYRNKKKGGSGVRLIFIVLLIIIFLAMSSRGGGKGGGSFMSRRGYRGISNPVWWIGGGSSGGWSGGGGGSGGGGFGGFGGGSFGGGGASGSW